MEKHAMLYGDSLMVRMRSSHVLAGVLSIIVIVLIGRATMQGTNNASRASAAAAASAPRFQRGLGFEAALAADISMNLRGASSAERMHVEGRLTTSVLDSDARGATVSLQLRDAQVTAPASQPDAAGRAALAELASQLSKVGFARYGSDGRIERLAFAPGTHATVQNLIELVASELQFVAPSSADDWAVVEKDASGGYLAEYHRAPDDRRVILKKKREYVAAGGHGGPVPKVRVAASAHRYVLDEHERLIGYQGHEQLELSLTDALGWATSLDLTLRDGKYGATDTHAELTALLTSAQWHPVEHVGLAADEQERRRDRELLGDLTVQALLAQLAGADLSKTSERAPLLRLFEASCRLHEADCLTMGRGAERGGRQAELLLGALGLCQTASARRALREVATDPVQAVAERGSALRYLARGDDPEAATVALFRSLLDASEPKLRQAARFGYGALASKLAKHGGAGAEPIVSDLLARLEAASGEERIELLRALGNTGSAAMEPKLRSLAGSADPVLRREAVGALRFVESETVDRLLEGAMRDALPNTRIAAIEATRVRRFGPLSAALVAAAQHDAEAGVRRAALDVLGVHLAEHPNLRALFQEVAAKDSDPSVRELASRNLHDAAH
jgi:hypothetical protein